MSEQQPTPEPGEKPKKPTPTQLKQELTDLTEVANARMTRIRDTEIKIQKCRTILKNDGKPGLSLTQDHFRLKTMVDELRKLLDVVGEIQE